MTLEIHPHPADIPPTNPNTCRDIALGFAKVMVILAAIALAIIGLSGRVTAPAFGQENGQEHGAHSIEHQALHEQFYAHWPRLDGIGSCCNNQDCYPTVMVQHAGKWWALHIQAMRDLELVAAQGLPWRLPGPDARTKNFYGADISAWVEIPENTLEHNARRADLSIKAPREPRDSPDGRSHACIGSSGFVYCAVAGLAQ